MVRKIARNSPEEGDSPPIGWTSKKTGYEAEMRRQDRINSHRTGFIAFDTVMDLTKSIKSRWRIHLKDDTSAISPISSVVIRSLQKNKSNIKNGLRPGINPPSRGTTSVSYSELKRKSKVFHPRSRSGNQTEQRRNICCSAAATAFDIHCATPLAKR